MTVARSRRPPARRPAADARSAILDAAERVYATHLPDAVGLREIAAAAGVSHGLVSHYFGSYAALVDAALARRFEAVRRAALAGFVAADDADALLHALLAVVADPVVARLLLWAELNGRGGADVLFAADQRGLGFVVDGLLARLGAHAQPVPERARVELVVLAGLAMALGLAAVGDAMQRSLGRETPAPSHALTGAIHQMLIAHLAGPPAR